MGSVGATVPWLPRLSQRCRDGAPASGCRDDPRRCYATAEARAPAPAPASACRCVVSAGGLVGGVEIAEAEAHPAELDLGGEAAGGACTDAAVSPSFPATRRHGGAAAARRERAGRKRWRGTERGESGGKAQSGGRALDFIKRAGLRAPKLAHARPLFPARAILS